jgi:predicted O-methyltransferase YrrM
MSWSAEFAVASVAPATGTVLRLLAASTQARSVVEIGTGLGVSGLWLLQGLRPDAVLTSIDVDSDHQAMALWSGWNSFPIYSVYAAPFQVVAPG